MSRKKRILVLGANGFIGSHLVDSLVQMDLEVIAFDRFSSEPRYNPSDDIKKIQGDIFTLSDVENALEDADYLMHTFSATTPYSADLDPFLDIDKNILNSARIFDLAGKIGVKKIIYISSGGAIYGASAENGKSANETDVALPISPYGISKLATERYLEFFERKYGIKHVSYRLSNPYGPRQITKHNQGVVPRFISNISANETINLYGDGSSSRDYIYIEDATHLITNTFEKSTHRVYNLGSGIQTTLTTLIDTLEELLGSNAHIKLLPEPASFVHTTQLDVSRFTDEFKQCARVDLKNGLSRTIEYLNPSGS